jgi:hypothetical protein
MVMTIDFVFRAFARDRDNSRLKAILDKAFVTEFFSKDEVDLVSRTLGEPVPTM